MHLFVLSLNYQLVSHYWWLFRKHVNITFMDELAECFRLATCEPKSANQNISAYGVMLFVSDLYFFILNFLLAFSKVSYIYRLLSSFGLWIHTIMGFLSVLIATMESLI